MSLNLVIMAAGMGSRYGGLKQIDSFGPNGETILEYSVYDAIRAGFNHIVLVIRESFYEDFQRVLGSKFEDKIRVSYVFQEVNPTIAGFNHLPERTKPRGTGHAVISAKQAIDGPFCVINADDYYGVSAFGQMSTRLSNNCKKEACSMVGYTLKNTLSDHGTVNRGICVVDENNHLTSIEEQLKIFAISQSEAKSETSDEVIGTQSIVSMNFWGFDQSILGVFEEEFKKFLQKEGDIEKSEFYITIPPNRFVHEEGKYCEVMVSKDKWYGVTYADDKPVVQEAIVTLLENDIYPENLWK